MIGDLLLIAIETIVYGVMIVGGLALLQCLVFDADTPTVNHSERNRDVSFEQE